MNSKHDNNLTGTNSAAQHSFHYTGKRWHKVEYSQGMVPRLLPNCYAFGRSQQKICKVEYKNETTTLQQFPTFSIFIHQTRGRAELLIQQSCFLDFFLVTWCWIVGIFTCYKFFDSGLCLCSYILSIEFFLIRLLSHHCIVQNNKTFFWLLYLESNFIHSLPCSS